MTITPLGRLELASRIALSDADGAWFVVGAEMLLEESELLAAELSSILREQVLVVELVEPQELVSVSLSNRAHPIVLHASSKVAEGLELDQWRNSLVRDRSGVLVLPPPVIGALATRYPHFTSWVGNEVHLVAEDRFLDQEAKTARLEALRARFGMSDDELIRRVRDKKALADPEIGEWLVLIGRGDMLPGGDP